MAGNVVSAMPGEKTLGFLDVGDDRYRVPIAVIRGVSAGRTPGLIGGTHGTEFASIEAVTRIINALDPAEMSGTVLAVPVLNRPQFEARQQFTSPIDGLNLNAVFPGDPKGTLTKRIAHVAFEEVASRCDALIDCHGGDIDEDIRGFVVAAEGDNATLNSEALILASCFDCGLVHLFPAGGGSSLGAQTTYGVPTIMPEAGTPYPVREEAVKFHYDGIMNALRCMCILPNEPTYHSQRISRKRLKLLATVDGSWHPTVSLDEDVKKGQEIGVVKDLFGKTTQVATTPEGGIVAMTRCFYSVKKGEILAVVSAFD
jgi:predicted deacylase